MAKAYHVSPMMRCEDMSGVSESNQHAAANWTATDENDDDDHPYTRNNMSGGSRKHTNAKPGQSTRADRVKNQIAYD